MSTVNRKSKSRISFILYLKLKIIYLKVLINKYTYNCLYTLSYYLCNIYSKNRNSKGFKILKYILYCVVFLYFFSSIYSKCYINAFNPQFLLFYIDKRNMHFLYKYNNSELLETMDVKCSFDI